MSRTDKDLPYWALDPWEARHHPSCGRRYQCDLPPWSGPLDPLLCVRRPRPRCDWSPTYTSRTRNGGQGNPPGWYIQHLWTNPDRVRTRDRCRRAAAEYRAGIDPDDLTIPPVDQHRHGAGWCWW